MLNFILCDYSDAYIHVKRTIAVPKTATAAANNTSRKVIFNNCTRFTDCASEIINAKVDNVKGIDVAMSMFDLIEYSVIYSKTSGSVWQCYIDELALGSNGGNDFPGNNYTALNFKEKITGQTNADSTKDIEIMVTLKYLSNFWGTLQIIFCLGLQIVL